MLFEVTIKFLGVGKSWLLNRVMDNEFKEEHNLQLELNLILSSSKLMEK